MQKLRLIVPTYNDGGSDAGGTGPEFGPPNLPVLVIEEISVRLLLGTHEEADMRKPEILVERHRGGWAIFLHPLGGGDPSGCVYLRDDGRSFVQPEIDGGPTTPVAMVEPTEDLFDLKSDL